MASQERAADNGTYSIIGRWLLEGQNDNKERGLESIGELVRRGGAACPALFFSDSDGDMSF